MTSIVNSHHTKDWCTFCDELSNKETSNTRKLITYDELPNIILKSTDHFSVIPGLGPMDQAYLLILPKESFSSIASLPSSWYQELNELKTYIRGILSQLFTEPIMFEHGPAIKQSLMAGCCIEHAHIHVFATRVSLITTLQKDYVNGLFGNHQIFSPQKISSYLELKQWTEEGISYLWYETNDQDQWGFPLTKNIQSQYFRRILAEELNLPDPEWDWSLYPGKEKIIETSKLLSEYMNGGASSLLK